MTTQAVQPPSFVASSSPSDPAVCAVAAVPQSVTALRSFARDVARRWLLPDEVEEALCLVVTELVTNVVLHSGSPEVTLVLGRGRAGVTAEVRDTGRWRARAGRRAVEADADALFGRGLQLVGAYATAWTRTTTAAGTRVIAHFAH
ncbi:ATP-binding protein [Kitasatospora sp. NBC_00240]|uniref:ATP-binding protein n=1 Tax=Kitasatospora sp. NBC_00240 TaxID=2903567 RepID=UPI002252604D|nr:ATP-binding protein [Kitasatospora sp. NBC_00240]MCX5208429.1 ATP-binding protein [Kitasatospora sp. NBC_00240]